MTEYTTRTHSFPIPAGVGAKGILAVIEQILTKPRVQHIHVSGSEVRVDHLEHPQDSPSSSGGGFDLDVLESMTPAHYLRRTEVAELPTSEPVADGTALWAVHAALDEVYARGQVPIAWLVRSTADLFKWYIPPGERVLSSSRLVGLPLHAHDEIPGKTLLLLAGYGRAASVLDATHTYKLTFGTGEYNEHGN